MKTLTVKREGTSTEFSYEIVWDGSYERLAGCVENLKLPAKKACIVTDSTVSELYLEEVKNVLSPLFETVTAFVFPAGEASKNLDTVKDLYTHLIENHFERKDILFALGGGVVGDLTGYAAATYLRGIDFIQLPTTLLAQVDSSVGGKTGVDFDQYKNMVGRSRGTAASPALMAAARPTCNTRSRHAEGTPAPAAGNSRARQPLSHSRCSALPLTRTSSHGRFRGRSSAAHAQNPPHRAVPGRDAQGQNVFLYTLLLCSFFYLTI